MRTLRNRLFQFSYNRFGYIRTHPKAYKNRLIHNISSKTRGFEPKLTGSETNLLSINPSKAEQRVELSNHGASIHLPNNDNPWFIIGASVTGNGHITEKIPCQDAHLFETWRNGWGIAVLSDGAGSAEKSHIASSFLVQETVKQAYDLVKNRNWIEKNILPNEEEWSSVAFNLLKKTQNALITFAEKEKYSLNHLHATLIAVIFSPIGLMVVHIGDGRAGYLDKDGQFKSLINPYEGEQAGETVFITMDFEKYPSIFESKIITQPIDAFFILSDGCEKVCWETLRKDEKSGRYIKPNKPFEPFFKQTIKVFTNQLNKENPSLLMQKWYNYLTNGHKGFTSEKDDKTMVIGMLANKQIEVVI